jgi:hypothetical protein
MSILWYCSTMNGQELMIAEEEVDIGVSDTEPEASGPMPEGSQDSPDSVTTTVTGLLIQGQTCVHETVCSVRETATGICSPGMVTLVRGGQGMPGKSPKKSCENGIWSAGQGL